MFVNVHLERTVERLSACDSAGLLCEVSDVHVCWVLWVYLCVRVDAGPNGISSRPLDFSPNVLVICFCVM